MAVNGVEIKAGQRWRTHAGAVVTIKSITANSIVLGDDGIYRDTEGELAGPECLPSLHLDELLFDEAPPVDVFAAGGLADQMVSNAQEIGAALEKHHASVKEADEGRRVFPDVLTTDAPTPPGSAARAAKVLGGAPMSELAQGLQNVRKAIHGKSIEEWRREQTGRNEAFDEDLVGPAETFYQATQDAEHPYHMLAATLLRAFEQASAGKGKERHASGATPFHDQPMATINRQLGSVDGFIYQAHKKSLEAKRLPDGRAQAELLGAINYLAGAVIALDTWAKKAPTGDAAEFHELEENRRRMNAMAAAGLSKGKKS